MKKKFGFGSIALLLSVLCIFLSVTFSKTGICYGDELLNMLGIKAWSNGTSGVHYTIFYMIPFWVLSIFLGHRFCYDFGAKIGRGLSSFFVFLVVISIPFSALSITSYESDTVVQLSDNFVNCDANNFEMNLYSDKKEYTTKEKIKIWGTLKYVGNSKTIKIWHGLPYMGYTITDGKDFETKEMMLTILKTTILEKSKLYNFNYQKTGYYDSDAPDADFWKKFYEEEDLLLPEGEYTIKFAGGFSLSEDLKEESGLLCELKIKVVK